MTNDDKMKLYGRMSDAIEKNLDKWIIDFIDDVDEARPNDTTFAYRITMECEKDVEDGDTVMIEFDVNNFKRARRHTIVLTLDN